MSDKALTEVHYDWVQDVTDLDIGPQDQRDDTEASPDQGSKADIAKPDAAGEAKAKVKQVADTTDKVTKMSDDDLKKLPSADKVKMVSVEDQAETPLARLATRMNAKDVMYIELPAREGSGRFATASVVVTRDDPGFIPALKDYLRTCYDMELRPQ